MTFQFDEEEFLELLMIHLDEVNELFKADDCAVKRLHGLLRSSDIPYLVAPDDRNDFAIVYVNVNGNKGTAEYRITHDPAGRDWLRISRNDEVIAECLREEEVFEMLRQIHARDMYVNENGFFSA
jgi:hypothetical protein